MEIVAHGLWTAAAAVTAKRSAAPHISVGWSVWWAAFPDVLAFGPGFAAGLYLKLAGSGPAPEDGHLLPHVHVGLPLYPAAHSLVFFVLAFALASLTARRVLLPIFGWMLHILIDIPTHSFSYYATRFLWPLSDWRVDGIAWWTPWFWMATYGALVLVYGAMWTRGWLWLARR